jgi:hypothetical protein
MKHDCQEKTGLKLPISAFGVQEYPVLVFGGIPEPAELSDVKSHNEYNVILALPTHMRQTFKVIHYAPQIGYV